MKDYIDVPELSDFSLTLGELREVVRVLIIEHGALAHIECDAGYNNVAVVIIKDGE